MKKKNNPDNQKDPKKENLDPFRDDPTEENEADVYNIHDQIVSREKGEPDEGFEPTPWWVWTVSVLVLFVMGFYLGKYSGTFGTVAHEVEMPPRVAEERIEREVRGDQLYAGFCQPCHGSDGMGTPGRYPPLVGSRWVTGDAETPALIVLYGLEGPIEVLGQTYNEQMDPFGHRLNNREVAAVVNYIRTSWGNDAPEIDAERVAELRETYERRNRWTARELQAPRDNE